MSAFDGIFRAMGISRSALEAQRFRIEVASGNIAHADVDSRSPGGAYKARRVVFESMLDSSSQLGSAGVRIGSIETDRSAGQKFRAPPGTKFGLDADGNLEKSNVEVNREMVDLMEASRSYEANIAAMRTYREMFMRALTLGA